MTQIKVLELMDAIQQTQKTADDMWRVLREVLEEQRNAQQSVQADEGDSLGEIYQLVPYRGSGDQTFSYPALRR